MMFRPGRGFTLIELLVVTAIIAILAAILFPVFASAKVAAKKTVCASNMRQLGLALEMYATDNGGGLPETSHTAGLRIQDSWVFTLRPYIANVDEIRICPADPNGKERLRENGTSYVLNGYLGVPGPDAVMSLWAIPRPSETITLFIVSDRQGVGSTSDHTHSYTWFSAPTNAWRRILADIQPDRHRLGIGRGTGPDRTEGTANYLYADTHVKSIPAGRIKGWADTNFNFAIPPGH